MLAINISTLSPRTTQETNSMASSLFFSLLRLLIILSCSCTRFSKSADSVASLAITGTRSFDVISGGCRFLCSLRPGDTSFCWDGTCKQIKRVYCGLKALGHISVGSRHVAVIDGNWREIRWWSYGYNRHAFPCQRFPKSVSGEYHSLTSGHDFTSLAVGSNQTCAITRKNGAVVCWGRHGSYFPMGSTRFEFLVSGGNLTCGLTSDAFNVSCWDSNEKNSSAVIQSLPKVLPGGCVSDEASCSCGIYPHSWNLCGGSGVICQKSDTSTVESCKQFSSQIIQHPLASSQSNRKKFMHKTGTLVYALFGVFVGVFFMFGVLAHLFRCIEWIGNQNETNLVGHILQDMENVETFTFDVLSEATNRFDTVLGTGSFSRVFLGQLADTCRVAVKRFKNNFSTEAEEMFINEVQTVYIGRHANVIKLIGCCTENHELIIVFEQMERKTLSNHLNPGLSERNSLIYCSWTMRVKILLDVAQGLRHLHQNAVPRIIHRDIKSSNILIDGNWVAKISDFGMALTGPEPGSEYVTTDQVAIGTPGYVDPDYLDNSSRVYPRFDVYSFGVVILEVLTGRRAVAADGTMLVYMVIPIIHDGRFDEVRDNRLDTPVGDEVPAIEMVVEIAQQCIRDHDRANINNVVTVLENALALCHQAPAPAPAPA